MSEGHRLITIDNLEIVHRRFIVQQRLEIEAGRKQGEVQH